MTTQTTNENFKYYEVTAEIDGAREVLYGSYLIGDCKYELDAERDSWKADGYKAFKIESKNVAAEPDPEVYDGVLVTAHVLWLLQAPSFNFELDEDELLAKALEKSFVVAIAGETDLYRLNPDY